MSNPYVSRGPVRVPDMFFGRHHELREIASFLNGNQSISIVGPRKIGKTSLLFHMLRPEIWPDIGLDDKNLFVYLDCEVLGESSHDELFGQFAGEMAEMLDSYGLPPEPALETAREKPTRLSFESAVRKLNQRGLRVVIILDEFERLSINPNLNLNFFNALRSAAGRYQLVFVTASARPLIELTYSGKSQEILSSPFFNIFAPLFLGLLCEDEACQLISDPSARNGVSFSPDLVDFLYNLAGGHPLALQVVCFHAFDQHDPAEIEERTIRELGSHFQYYWHNLTPIEQDTLRQLSDAVTRAAGDTAQRAALRDLVQECLLVTDGTVYDYPSRAWANFVGAQHRSTQTILAAGGALTGVTLGSYEVLELIGRGGMAEVYKGYHPRLDRTVAIKVLSADLAGESDFRRRFEREARAVAALRHPNIMQVFDFGDVDGMYYMVMEYIAGQTLGHIMRESGPMPVEQIWPILSELAAALDYAHSQNLIHRDIKPANVMLQDGNSEVHAILMDFGIAKMLKGDSGNTQTGVLTGTLDYMAPEQIRASGEIDNRADIYALGVMLYQMLTGRLPFTGDNIAAIVMAHLQNPVPDPRELIPRLPPSVAAITMRAMAKIPEERYPTAGSMVAALRL